MYVMHSSYEDGQGYYIWTTSVLREKLAKGKQNVNSEGKGDLVGEEIWNFQLMF